MPKKGEGSWTVCRFKEGGGGGGGKRRGAAFEGREGVDTPLHTALKTSVETMHILESHKVKLIFYTENSLHKLLCRPKNVAFTEHKDKVVYKIELLTLNQCTLLNVSIK